MCHSCMGSESRIVSLSVEGDCTRLTVVIIVLVLATKHQHKFGQNKENVAFLI